MGGFFRRLDIVVIDDGDKRWCVALILEGRNADGEAVQVADLTDEDGKARTVDTERLTKVAG